MRLARYWRVDSEHVGLIPKHLCPFIDDPECLVLGQPSLAVEVVLQEGDVGF
jgi:hypothetical protein